MSDRDRWDELALTLLPEHRHDDLGDSFVIAKALREAFEAGRKSRQPLRDACEQIASAVSWPDSNRTAEGMREVATLSIIKDDK